MGIDSSLSYCSITLFKNKKILWDKVRKCDYGHEKVLSKLLEKLLQETKQLLEKDVHNINILFQEFYRSQDYNSLPLTKSKLYCKRCPYKTNCPIDLQ